MSLPVRTSKTYCWRTSTLHAQFVAPRGIVHCRPFLPALCTWCAVSVCVCMQPCVHQHCVYTWQPCQAPDSVRRTPTKATVNRKLRTPRTLRTCADICCSHSHLRSSTADETGRRSQQTCEVEVVIPCNDAPTVFENTVTTLHFLALLRNLRCAACPESVWAYSRNNFVCNSPSGISQRGWNGQVMSSGLLTESHPLMCHSNLSLVVAARCCAMGTIGPHREVFPAQLCRHSAKVVLFEQHTRPARDPVPRCGSACKRACRAASRRVRIGRRSGRVPSHVDRALAQVCDPCLWLRRDAGGPTERVHFLDVDDLPRSSPAFVSESLTRRSHHGRT